MRVKDRYELAAELQTRYWRAGKKERGAILDGFCLATGYQRKHAITVLRGRRRAGPVGPRPIRQRPYGPTFRRALAVLWEASGYICAERLQPFLEELAPMLEGHGQLSLDETTRQLLATASVSTVERNLRLLRKRVVGRRMSQTKPGTLLRRQIPIVMRWREDDLPGYLEIDLVSHSGEIAAGTFLYTLSTVDLSSGWSERIPVMGKGQAGVVAALDRIREQLPFRLRGIHPDNGSEFINHHMWAYCQEHNIAFSRSRPYCKNDNAHVEQKNWTLVRRLIGYNRLDTPEQMAWLDALYTELLRPHANCFQPVMKLMGKEAVGQRTRRIYDRPTTPLRRVLDSGQADFSKLNALVELRNSISPLTLKRQLDRALAAMPAALGVRASA